MSSLTLVRHGQASFSADDYDRLSPTGIEQARLLGDFWARQGVVFDSVHVGPRLRQRQTAELVGARIREAGLSWPEHTTVPELDEYDLDGLLKRFAPALARREPEFEVLARAYLVGDGDRVARFQKMFEVLLTHWQTEEANASEVEMESWPVFRDRVRLGLNRIVDRPGRGRRVAAFTSGGFIGTAVGLVLAAPDRAALELNWRLRNASLTRLMFTPVRLTLDEFNAVPHLNDPALWTYR